VLPLPPATAAPCVASAAPPPAAPAFPDLSWILRAEVVRIERGRGGLLGTWVAHYDLRRRGDAFVGLAILVMREPARHSPGAPPTPPRLRSSALEVTVPLVAMQALVEALSRSTSRPPDPPRMVLVTASDDYPWWIVDVEAPVECSPAHRCARFKAARFSSPATGQRPAPWFLEASERPIELDPAPLSNATEGLATQLRDVALDAALR